VDDVAPRALRPVPDVGHVGALAREALHDLQDQVVAVAEVDVERRAGQVCSPHHLVDGELPERALTEQLLSRGDDFLFRDLGTTAPPAPTGR
jgi:hypothetical protein